MNENKFDRFAAQGIDRVKRIDRNQQQIASGQLIFLVFDDGAAMPLLKKQILK